MKVFTVYSRDCSIPCQRGRWTTIYARKETGSKPPQWVSRNKTPALLGTYWLHSSQWSIPCLELLLKRQQISFNQSSGVNALESLFQREIAPVVSSFRYTSFIAHSFSSKWKHRRATSNLESTKFSSKDDYAGALTAAPKFLASGELLSLLIAMETGISRGNWSGSSKQRAEDVSKWRGFSRKLSILSL